MASYVSDQDAVGRGKPQVCTLAVVYEDAPARDLAIRLCDGLARKFEKELDFEFTWWRFKYLSEPEIARQAGRAVAAADLIIVSIHSGDDFPLEVKAWFDGWLSKRALSEGALVLVRAPGDEEGQILSQEAYFRLVAQRANLDYLPFPLAGPTPRSTDRLREDAFVPDAAASHQKPDHQYHSSGWGINE